MQHRHLNHQNFILAAIDDIINRGRRQDWAALRHAALGDRLVMEKIRRICDVYVQNPYAQRHHFWKEYADRHQV